MERGIARNFIGDEDILDAGVNELFGLPEACAGDAASAMLELESGKFEDAMIFEVRAKLGLLRGEEIRDGAEVVLHGVEVHEKSGSFDVGDGALWRV